ncbi:hypothetical protein F511_36371 [Dorcoceras hygrometricum]|uniref:Uncharacterized protein n=1 Tax=Dorcoceras hygrometricum TaxID=472368 RepID=A0A2Z7AKZ7_9LAMI|nr:hypothetical protein F511_36371 [Dorcoceras hygrometricum]
MHSTRQPPPLAFGPPAPADLAGAPPAGPPPGTAGPNLTSPGPNPVARGSTNREKEAHRAALKHAAHGVSHIADGSAMISHLWTTPSPP